MGIVSLRMALVIKGILSVNPVNLLQFGLLEVSDWFTFGLEFLHFPAFIFSLDGGGEILPYFGGKPVPFLLDYYGSHICLEYNILHVKTNYFSRIGPPG